MIWGTSQNFKNLTNTQSLTWGRLLRIKIETQHGIFTTLVWNKFWDLFEEFIANFWELKRERERQRESLGTLLGISGTSVENLFGWEQN
jgi:hypothetical protein